MLEKFDRLYRKIIAEQIEYKDGSLTDEEQKEIDAYKETLTDEEREACKDLGYMNGWGPEKNKLDDIHERLKKEHPEFHKESTHHDGSRCYTEYRCSCGYVAKVDSSG